MISDSALDRLTTYVNNGAGVFTASGVTFSTAAKDMQLYDMNGDMSLDIIQTQLVGNGIKISMNNGSGVFSTGSILVAGAIDFAVGDLDGDTDLDIVSVNGTVGGASVLLNDGIGGFTHDTVQENILNTAGVGYSQTRVLVADFDANGSQDIMIDETIPATHAYHFYENNGTGGFVLKDQALMGTFLTTPLGVDDFHGSGNLTIINPNQLGYQTSVTEALSLPYPANKINYINVNVVAQTTVNYGSRIDSGYLRLPTADFNNDGIVDFIDGSVVYLTDNKQHASVTTTFNQRSIPVFNLPTFKEAILKENDALNHGGIYNGQPLENGIILVELRTPLLSPPPMGGPILDSFGQPTYSTVGVSFEQLKISSTGTGLGQIAYDAVSRDISYEGSVIGSVDSVKNGVNGQSLLISLQPNVSLVAVDALMHLIDYSVTSTDAFEVSSQAADQIYVTINDGKISGESRGTSTSYFIDLIPYAAFPTATDDAVQGPPQTALTIDSIANDSAFNPGTSIDSTTLEIVTQPANGTVAIVNGKFEYTGNASFGSDSFTYRVKDSVGAPTNVATVTITENILPLFANASAITFTEGAETNNEKIIASGITVTDADDTQLQSVRIEITGNLDTP